MLSALLTHRRIALEKHIDKLVLKDLKLELSIGFVSIIFLIWGYVLHLIIQR